jgi:hypothetical protein
MRKWAVVSGRLSVAAEKKLEGFWCLKWTSSQVTIYSPAACHFPPTPLLPLPEWQQESENEISNSAAQVAYFGYVLSADYDTSYGKSKSCGYDRCTNVTWQMAHWHWNCLMRLEGLF